MNPQPPEAGATPSAGSILIIDDDAHLAAVMALGLETNGYSTMVAPDGTIGLEMAHAHMPDLILCDVDMPGKDGRALLKELRADPKLSDRQFVLMTGRAPMANQRTGMDLGADDFLLKPFDLAALIRCVEARMARAGLKRGIDDQGVEQLRKSLNSSLPREFFTPLAGILGLTELLQKELDTASKDEIRDYLREIHDAGRRLHRRLSNYLLILGLDPKGAPRESGLLGADMVVKVLSEGANASALRHNRVADLGLDLVGASIQASPADLAALSEELVDNALTYSDRGTPVRVRTRPDSGLLRLTVVDLGRGMTPKQQRQLDSGTTGESKSLENQSVGVGLTLVRKLVQVLNGEIRLESEVGKGTTIHIALPIRGA
jgi:two-component system, sensor histidine kinase and response regulator